MKKLTPEELTQVKKLFITSAKNYFHKPEQLKILESAYSKIIGSNLKDDWGKIANLMFPRSNI